MWAPEFSFKYMCKGSAIESYMAMAINQTQCLPLGDDHRAHSSRISSYIHNQSKRPLSRGKASHWSCPFTTLLRSPNAHWTAPGAWMVQGVWDTRGTWSEGPVGPPVPRAQPPLPAPPQRHRKWRSPAPREFPEELLQLPFNIKPAN